MASQYYDDLDKDALMGELNKPVTGQQGGELDAGGVGAAGDKTGGKDAGVPTSNTMPVREAPGAMPPEAAAAPAAPAARRGSWGNLNLDAGTQRNINQFSGFNADRALAGADDDSVKDAFQRWAGQQDFNLKGKTKDQIGDFYKQNLQNMKDYGLDVRDVQGEKILINTKERGPEWIDSVIAAGGDNPMFGWQAEYDNIGNAALGDGGATVRQQAAAQNPALLNAISGGEGGADQNAQTQAQIDALINGQTPPMDQAALLEQLNQV